MTIFRFVFQINFNYLNQMIISFVQVANSLMQNNFCFVVKIIFVNSPLNQLT